MQVHALSRQPAEKIARYAAIFSIVGAIGFIHIFLPFRFPTPWPDEASFIAPAFELARHGTLFVWGMNPDRVVMWMPPGYFVFLAALFKVFGYSFALVRWASAACIVAAMLLAGHFVRCFVNGRWAVFLHLVTAMAFLSPYVLMSANIGRMDALLTLLALLSLLACINRLPVLGAAIVGGAATIHFNAVYFMLPHAVYFAWLLVARRRLVVVPVEMTGVAVACVVLGAYGLLVKSNLMGFVEDIHFQFQLKRFFGHNDPIHPLWPLLVAGLLTIAVIIRQRGVGGAAFLALYGTAFVLMATQGKEIWYDLGPPIGFLLISIALVAGDNPPAFRHQPISVLCVVACLVCLLATGYRPTRFLIPLLPTRAMLSHDLLPKADMDRMRVAIRQLPPGTTLEYAWGGVQPFFLDAMDHADVRWGIPQHSVTNNTLDRRADWRVQCDSPDIPAYLRIYYPQALHDGNDVGCDLARVR